ncbi:unnamed protein product [Peniophora sp. CBMAI 1063]|nr:unnamed protein product [Peniophora sp. CBMAI 1063]
MLYESASDVAIHSPRLPVSLSSPILTSSPSSHALCFLARPIPTYPSAPSSPVPPSPDTPLFAEQQQPPPQPNPSVWVTPSSPHTFRAFRLEFGSPPGLGLGVGPPPASLATFQPPSRSEARRIFSGGSSGTATPRPTFADVDFAARRPSSTPRGRTNSIKRPGSHDKSRLPRQRAFVLSPTPNSPSPRVSSPAVPANERLKDFRALVAKMRTSTSFGSSGSQVFSREGNDSDWTDESEDEDELAEEDEGVEIDMKGRHHAKFFC